MNPREATFDQLRFQTCPLRGRLAALRRLFDTSLISLREINLVLGGSAAVSPPPLDRAVDDPRFVAGLAPQAGEARVG